MSEKRVSDIFQEPEASKAKAEGMRESCRRGGEKVKGLGPFRHCKMFGLN